MDIIYLHDLKIECVIGIWEWERRIKQTVIFDLDMATDIRRAAASDHIDDTLNYKAVAKRLLDYVGNSQFQLVETLAEKVAEILLTEFRLDGGERRIDYPYYHRVISPSVSARVFEELPHHCSARSTLDILD